MENVESQVPVKPENYMVFSVFTTLFCFLPLGIVALIFGYLTDARYADGDYEGAQRASEKAKLFSSLTLAVGLFLWVGILRSCGCLP